MESFLKGLLENDGELFHFDEELRLTLGLGKEEKGCFAPSTSMFFSRRLPSFRLKEEHPGPPRFCFPSQIYFTRLPFKTNPKMVRTAYDFRLTPSTMIMDSESTAILRKSKALTSEPLRVQYL